jgi:uncharacterized protein
MPTAPTYPGVYIEELPSGVRTITGVPTSITAFIGRAMRGPTNEPVVINSFGDFERIFGGLWLDPNEPGANVMLGFSVRDFFTNAGGGQAIVVRVAKNAVRAAVDLGNGNLVEAISPGKWGSNLRFHVDHATANSASTMEFNLTVAEVDAQDVPIRIEVLRNLSVDPAHSRRIDLVLGDTVESNESTLIRWVPGTAVPGARPAQTYDPAANEIPVWTTSGAVAPKQDASPFTTAGTDGDAITFTEVTGNESAKTGIYALEKADIFNLLTIPPYKDLLTNGGNIDESVINDAVTYCEKRRAMFIIDPPTGWNDKAAARSGVSSGTGIGTGSKNAAIFFPRLRKPNPLRENKLEPFAPGGAVAGIFARTDAERGVWKAPAGLDATLRGVPDLTVKLTDPENGELNPLGLNCLRQMPGGLRVVWGSRTRVGADRLANEWKYVPVRRLALFLEESLYRGTTWAVFEPNDEPLWAALRLNIGAFMHGLFRQGAFQGRVPREAYFVSCDSSTTTQNDINLGIVNVIIGFAPLKPAEFVILKFQQMAGQIQA